MGNSNAPASSEANNHTRDSLTPAFCGPTANLKHLSSFYQKYQMGDTMWAGRNSSVRACRHRGSNEWNLIAKRISRNRIRKLHMENSLSREIMALKEFGHHKCIVELVDVCEDDPEEVFMLFRLLQGGDLFNIISKQGALCESDAKRLVLSVASALKLCHENHWVHRDIKPENVLCTNGDISASDFQLCDFGFACTQDSVTGSREFVGSVGYQAPEVIMQQEGASVSPAVDMWGLGCLMYVAVTGSMPFFHRDDRIVEQMTVDGVVDLSSEKLGHLSSHVEEILSRLFAYEPSERMTIQELLEHPWLEDVDPVDIKEPEAEFEPIMISCSSTNSSSLSTLSSSTLSRDSSEESLPDRASLFIVPPASTIPSDIPIFTQDQLERMAAEMRAFVTVKDRKYHLRTYRKCWLGKEGVDFLAKTLGSERAAVAVGNQMITLGLMRHVVGDHDLKKRNLFYRFKEDEEALALEPIKEQWEHVLRARPMVSGI